MKTEHRKTELIYIPYSYLIFFQNATSCYHASFQTELNVIFRYTKRLNIHVLPCLMYEFRHATWLVILPGCDWYFYTRLETQTFRNKPMWYLNDLFVLRITCFFLLTITGLACTGMVLYLFVSALYAFKLQIYQVFNVWYSVARVVFC